MEYNLDHFETLSQFAKDIAPLLGVKPLAVVRTADRHAQELAEIGAVLKTRGKSRLVNKEIFLKWYFK